ncbi:MAG: translation elongation factor Ts [Calditrichaeota bacterium]|nr:translation elongation factor Ts [Candidatus Cloacimonadota bacterium]MCB1047147.1 translation elongation factor Ts [Calditrichota bacterium]MCB9472792.1 translation elongation factor Ts [Candidatus Delongbacteria bacterium]
MEVSAKDVMKLRQATGAGMMDCKKALAESGGSFDEAMDYLRKKGLKTAEKRADRDANEGKVVAVISADGRQGALLELNSETDFVSGTEDFRSFAQACASQVLAHNPADGDALMALAHPGADGTLGDTLNTLVGKLGEKIGVRRFSRVEIPAGEQGVVQSYIHLGDKHGVMLHATCGKADTASNDSFKELVNDLCLQIVAYGAKAVDRDGLDLALIEKELELYREITRNEGKPEAMIDKIAEGKLNKFVNEVTLLGQTFVKDDKATVQQHINSVGKSLGDTLVVKGFSSFVIGE